MEIEKTIQRHVVPSSEEMESEISRYQSLLKNLKSMIDHKYRGFNSAKEMNKDFWRHLDVHASRIEEQVHHLKSTPPEKWTDTLENSDSIYEAAREWQMKHEKPQ